jgi:hypothetical protein
MKCNSSSFCFVVVVRCNVVGAACIGIIIVYIISFLNGEYIICCWLFVPCLFFGFVFDIKLNERSIGMHP